ncbi:FkbO/Hyg5 family chorismatase [Lentzea sp. NPDC051213]|uniref:FkbO/Hyg5 family chorismatase n=1 Tax=Lentzea sp. NPDC051213 TaxID=3364126 RepID=UPI0037AF328F
MTQAQQTVNLPTSQFTGLNEVSHVAATENVLGVINYTTECRDPRVENGLLTLDLHMAVDLGEAFAEVWSTSRPVETGEHHGIVYAHDGEYLLVTGRIAPTGRYTEETRAAYVAALDLMDTLGYKNCFRMWNFINDINADNTEGLEIYRDFCKGRAEAFELFHFGDKEVPSATGIGSQGGGIAFYFLASRSAALTSVENSKQMAAYHYPRQYGPRPPKFARATYLAATHTDRRSGQIYVAGTASIRGHETVHDGDLARQVELSLDNIEHLISDENLAEYEIEQGNSLLNLDNIKVYVRHRADIPAVRKMCEQRFSPNARIQYLNVDVCRADLLVEIEGVVA